MYIHNWSLQPFSQDYDLAFCVTYVECVNFIPEWQDQQFKVDFERQIFEKLIHDNFIFTVRALLEDYLESQEIYFYISFCWRYLKWR